MGQARRLQHRRRAAGLATNGVVKSSEATLTTQWRRVHVVLPYDQRKKQWEGRQLQAPADAVLEVVALTPGSWALDALMVEQAGIHYSNRTTPSTWVRGGQSRGSEVLNVPFCAETRVSQSGTVALWVRPEPGDIVKGCVVTVESAASLDPGDYPTEYFRPEPAQVAGAIGLILAGFGITYALSRIAGGGDSERRA